jgi:hypothetical protein
MKNDITDLSLKQQIINNLISNKLEIVFPDGEFSTITETNIESESMSLKQSICDENKLKFGGCIASELKITLLNTTSRTFTPSKLKGCWVRIKLTQTYPNKSQLLPAKYNYPATNMYPDRKVLTQAWTLFNGIIDSATVDKNDCNKISITAYDLVSQLYEEDATNHLLDFWNNSQELTVSEVLNLVAYKIMSIVGKISGSDNYDVWVSFYADEILNETINTADKLTVGKLKLYNAVWKNSSDKITYGKLFSSIAEMLGVFVMCKPSGSRKGGSIEFVKLETDTAKAEAYDFYEAFYADEKSSGTYGTVDFAIGGASRTAKVRSYKFLSGKTYDMTDNILVWQKNDNAGGAWIHKFENLFSGDTGKRLHHKSYIPIEVTLDGRVWVEPGDMVKVKYYVTDADGNYVYNADGTPQTATVTSYVLSRELTGIQALTDKITAKGE